LSRPAYIAEELGDARRRICEEVPAAIGAVWQVWTDVNHWTDWDPHEEAARLDAPFATGAVGWVKPKGAPGGAFTLTLVEPERRWCSRSKIPFGRLDFDHQLAPTTTGGTRVTVRIDASGPFAPIFRLVFAPRMQRDLPQTIAALGRRAAGQDNPDTPRR